MKTPHVEHRLCIEREDELTRRCPPPTPHPFPIFPPSTNTTNTTNTTTTTTTRSTMCSHIRTRRPSDAPTRHPARHADISPIPPAVPPPPALLAGFEDVNLVVVRPTYDTASPVSTVSTTRTVRTTVRTVRTVRGMVTDSSLCSCSC